MKEAMWALGLFVLGLIGIVLINLFGNITTTDQLNYTTMKNTVDASLNESLSASYFNTGFCVCTDLKQPDGKWVFNNTNEYELADISFEGNSEKCLSKKKYCKIIYGDYRVDKKRFIESITRRFAEMVNNNKNYRMIVQEIIEYPPKVSVRFISTDDEISPTEEKPTSYEIVNQIDSIIESSNEVRIIDESAPKVCSTPTPTPTPTQEPTSEETTTSTPTPTPTAAPTCYYSKSLYKYCNKSESKCKKESADYEPYTLKEGEVCENACYCKDNTCSYYAIYDWNSNGWPGWFPLLDENNNYIKEGSDKPCAKATPTPEPSSDYSCSWHHNSITIKCVKQEKLPDGSVRWAEQYPTFKESSYDTCPEAEDNCNQKANNACSKFNDYSKSTNNNYDCTPKQDWNYECNNGTKGTFTKSGCSDTTSCASKCGNSGVKTCNCNG